jgi:hypothetical protein
VYYQVSVSQVEDAVAAMSRRGSVTSTAIYRGGTIGSLPFSSPTVSTVYAVSAYEAEKPLKRLEEQEGAAEAPR